MIQVEFLYNKNNIIIQCNKSENMREIFKKFVEKAGIDINSIFFKYNETIIIDDELTLEEISNENDTATNHIKIFVNLKKSSGQGSSNIKFKELICPECGELSNVMIENYKIYFDECKNGHKIDNIFLKEFEKTQEIGLSNIICEQCKINNKANTFNNEFYKCYSCKINLCPSCKLNHDKNHKIINFEKNYYLCDIHNENFNSYCQDCKINLCNSCAKIHNLADFNIINPGIPLNHSIINYGKIPKKDDLKNKIKEIREKIDKMENDTKEIFEKLNKAMDNIELYFKIINNIINNYDEKKFIFKI